MGISRVARNRWVAIPMMAATIGLTAPAAAQASTTDATVRTATTSSSTSSTSVSPTSTDRLAAGTVTEVSLGSALRDHRGLGADRYRRL